LQELSQRNTSTFRNRSKSTTQNILNRSQGAVDRKRNNSYSASRPKTQQPMNAQKAKEHKANLKLVKNDNSDLAAMGYSKSATLKAPLTSG